MATRYKSVAYTLLAAAAFSGAAQAQTSASSVTLYGSLDQYVNIMRSSSGARVKSLEDGSNLRSRFGLRGTEDLGGGLVAKFQMEGGFSSDTGTQADGARFWDRQTWIGLATPVGEFRIGRQNGPIQARGNYVDFTARNLGSVVNNFGVPSRYDNDLSYISPRVSGLQFEGHVALPESPVGNRPLIYQVALDYVSTDYRLGYAGARAKPPSNAIVNKDVVYDSLWANWMYGKGTVYLAYVRSNNSTPNAVSNTAGQMLGNTSGYNAGNNTDLNNFYSVWQVSADYSVSPQLRVGALWGKIDDRSGRSRGADGAAIGAYYDLSKRTTLIAMWETLDNDANGGWRPSGSAGMKTTFTTPNDINGRTISGVQVGVIHRF